MNKNNNMKISKNLYKLKRIIKIKNDSHLEGLLTEIQKLRKYPLRKVYEL